MTQATQNANNKSVKKVLETPKKTGNSPVKRKNVPLPILSEADLSGVVEHVSRDKYRSRNFMLLLYPDCPEHMQALEVVQQNYSFLMVTHDKDVTPDGELKKKHIHVFLKFKNPKWNTAVASEVNLDPRFIQQVRNEENAMLYLMHYNEEKKHHYSPDEIFGTTDLLTRLNNLLRNKDEQDSDILTELILLITEQEVRNISTVAKICVQKGPKWLKILSSRSYLFAQMCKDNRENGNVIRQKVLIDYKSHE